MPKWMYEKKKKKRFGMDVVGESRYELYSPVKTKIDDDIEAMFKG